MAVILEQDDINVLVERQEHLTKAAKAQDKLDTMYRDILHIPILGKLDSIMSIEAVIIDMQDFATPDWQYWEDLERLRISFNAKFNKQL